MILTQICDSSHLNSNWWFFFSRQRQGFAFCVQRPSYDLQKWRAFVLYCGAAELYAIYSVQYGTHPVICYLTFLETLSSISWTFLTFFTILKSPHMSHSRNGSAEAERFYVIQIYGTSCAVHRGASCNIQHATVKIY